MDAIKFILHNLYIKYIILIFKLIYSLFNYLIILLIYIIMSEKLNKEIRDFFIKLGQDIKDAFDNCCPCDCLNRKTRIYAKNTTDIEKQITDDIIDIDELNSHEFMFKNKIIINALKPVKQETKINDIIGDEEKSNLDSDDDFIIIF